jgi:predicted TIM-barrel fold metal-dependent hydrolase
VGDDFLVTATDFPHGDAFRQDQLANGLKSRGDLSDQTIEKILSDNPQRLFHF